MAHHFAKKKKHKFKKEDIKDVKRRNTKHTVSFENSVAKYARGRLLILGANMKLNHHKPDSITIHPKKTTTFRHVINLFITKHAAVSAATSQAHHC